MCELITFSPNSLDFPLPKRAVAIHVERQLHVEKFEGSQSGHQHPGKLRIYSLTSGGCSCGLLPEARDTGYIDRHESRLRQKAAKLHWSKAKTERAVADSRASALSGGNVTEKAARDYLAGIAEACGGLSLIMHIHDAAFATEKFSVVREEKLSASQLRSESLSIQNDVRYLVQP